MLSRLYTCFKSIVTAIAPISMGVIGLAIVQMTTPPVVFGQQSQNNTAVFSGQVIPAFIGTAYDPSEAYQRLAGLPIYVFAYDSWGGTNFIHNNLAIRTQIRLDGSFQAQGLPHGVNYGVYFPFILEGGNTIRIDCPDAPNGNQGPCAGTVSGTNVQFRMPQASNADLIQDVFSYNMSAPGGSPRAICGVQTQIQDETICLGPSFLTSETRVDIANNINTFPLVPTSSMKITTKALCNFLTYCPVPYTGAYEVVAQRVVDDIYSAGDLLSPVEGPIIRGRTTFPLEAQHNPDNQGVSNDRIFQAYAPPGVYAITVWRADGSTTYNNFEANSSIQSALTGFAILRIQRSEDWSIVLTKNHRIPLRPQQFVIWGRTHTSLGNPTTNAIFVNMTNTSFNTSLHAPKMRTEGCDELFWTFEIPSPSANMYPGNCNRDGSTGSSDPVRESYGLYALYDRGEIGFSPRTNTFEVYVDTTDYSRDTTSTEQIFTTDGPHRVDMTTVLESSNSGGILLTIQAPTSINNTGQPSNPGGSRVFTLRATATADPDSDVVEIPAAGKSYSADMLGQIKISHADLQPRGGETSFYLRFLIKHPYSELYTEYDTNPIEYNGTYQRVGPIQLAQLLPREQEPYKLLGFIPAGFLLPRTPDAFADQSRDHAHITLSFSNAKSYQSLVLENDTGATVDSLDEQTLATKTADWTHDWILPYVDPLTHCRGVGVLLYFSCLKDANELNTYTVTATADEQVLSKSFRARSGLGGLLGGNAYAVPTSYDFKFLNECGVMEKSLSEQYVATTDAERAANLANAKGLAQEIGAHVSNAISRVFDFRKFQEVNLPVMGCHVSLTVSDLMASGLQTLQTVLIMDPLTTSLAVLNTWEVIRGMANIFFIFILLIIGVNQIMGIDRKTWSANAMLPQLILGIVLANISLLLVQFVLDINNILTAWIFSIIFDVLQTSGISANAVVGVGAAGASMATFTFLSTILSTGITAAITSILGTGGTILIPLIGAILIGVFALAAMAIMILAILYGRYLIIWILTIVAPIIFAISVLPWARSMRNMWWKTVIPISAIQTFVAVLLSIGILLLSKGVEADGMLKQAGVFLIGGATLAMATKAPQLAVQLLGAGGMAGAALGAVTAVGSKLSGMTQTLGQGIGGSMSREAIENREDQAAMLQGMGIKTSRIPFVNSAKAGFAQAKIATVKRVDELGEKEKAGAAAHTKIRKVEKAGEELYDQRLAEDIEAKKPTLRESAEHKFATEVRPDLEIQRELELTPPRMANLKKGLDSWWNNTEQKLSVLNAQGEPTAMTLPELKANIVQTISIDDARRPALLEALNKAGGIDTVASTLQKNGFTDPVLAQDIKKALIERAHTSDKANLYVPGALGSVESFSVAGSRSRAVERQAEGTQAAPPQSGGGGARGQS